MSLPTLDQYRTGATTWKREHLGVSYTLSHHGVSDYSTAGTWCFYIHLLEPQFQRAEDFAQFDREPEVREFAGTHRESYPYDDVPDYGFHGGITWYSREQYVDRDGERRKSLKIGCDYGHSWDRDSGYWQGLEDVERDAKALIAKLVAAIPLKQRCAYCGTLDMPDQFYTARNGARVHISQLSKFSETEWPTWLPATPSASDVQGSVANTSQGTLPPDEQNLPPLEASRDAESSRAVVSELVEALKAIDAMPRYTAPVPPEWVSGLLARYHKALDLAEAALSKAVQS